MTKAPPRTGNSCLSYEPETVLSVLEFRRSTGGVQPLPQLFSESPLSSAVAPELRTQKSMSLVMYV